MEKKTVGEKYTVVVMLEQERRANAPEHQGRNGHKLHTSVKSLEHCRRVFGRWWERPLATLNRMGMNFHLEVEDLTAFGEDVHSDGDENSGEELNDEEEGPSTTTSTTSTTSTSTTSTCSTSTSLHKDTGNDVKGEEER